MSRRKRAVRKDLADHDRFMSAWINLVIHVELLNSLGICADDDLPTLSVLHAWVSRWYSARSHAGSAT